MRYTARHSLLPPLWIISVTFAVLLICLLVALKEIVMLLVVGYAMAYLMDPALRKLESWTISRAFGVVVILSVLVLAIILLTLTALPTILREWTSLVSNLPDYIETAKEKAKPLLEQAEAYIPVLHEKSKVEALFTLIPSINAEMIGGILNRVFQTLLQGYSIALTILNLALLPFIVFYLAVDWEKIHASALSLFPLIQRQKVKGIFSEIDKYVSAFARGQLTVGAILFLLYAAGLGLVGVELWFLLAVISGFGNCIPYLGFLIGIVLSSIMALVTFGDFYHLAAVWAVYLVVQFLEGNLITPRILGDKVGLSPLVIILSIVAGGSLFGLVGIFLAVPGAAIVRVLARHMYQWLLKRAQGG